MLLLFMSGVIVTSVHINVYVLMGVNFASVLVHVLGLSMLSLLKSM